MNRYYAFSFLWIIMAIVFTFVGFPGAAIASLVISRLHLIEQDIHELKNRN